MNLSKFFLILICLTGVFTCFGQQKPNVIIFLTDDQGSIDLNCYGATDLSTPHMDNLAKSGVMFTQFYAAAPVCSPSRASMLTGLNPHAAGVPTNAPSSKGEAGMPTEKITMAEMMQDAGYVTGHFGKWHLGYSPETMPNQQGFDYSFGHMGGCIDNFSHFFYWNGPNRHDLWENGKEIWRDGQYFPDLIEAKAEDFLEQHQHEPFFMYYAINLPHYPLQPDIKWREYYRDLPRPRQDYAAFISTIDDRLGQLIQKLEALGIRENTVIIFQSDHGHSTEERTFGGGGNAGPYRGAKFSLFEGGIRVPAMISWPGHIPENEKRDQMAFNIDWLPTIAELCGIRSPVVEGKSLMPVINDAKVASPHLIFYWKTHHRWAIRSGDWKLLGNPQDTSNKGELDPQKDKLFLVNLADDVSEMKNLASDNPEKVKELTAAYKQWQYFEPDDIPK